MVLPASALSRSGAEQDIRSAILRDDRIESVVFLPAGLFPTARLETVALVITEAAVPARRGRILLARAEAEGRGRDTAIANVEELLAICETWREVPGVSRVVDIQEIAANDWVVSAARFLSASPVRARVDLPTLRARLQEQEALAREAAGALDLLLDSVSGERRE